MAKSPSITLIEKDSSSYAVTTSATVLAAMGYATFGKIGEPVLVTSRNEFLEKFGTPPTSAPWAHLAVYRAFNQGNQVIYERVAQQGEDFGDTYGDSGAAYAERIIGDTADWGGDTAKAVQIRAKYKGSYGNNIRVIVSFEQDPTTATNVYEIQVYDGTNLKETFSEVTWDVGDSNFFETRINATIDNNGSDWIQVDTWSAIGDSTFDISGDSAGKTYLVGVSDGGDSDAYAAGDSWQSAGATKQYDYRPGLDGVATGDTDSANLHATELSTSGHLANMELYDYHVLITPDSGSQVTQDAAITLAAYRKDFVYVADPPYGLTYSQVVDWHNGAGGHGRTTAINSSYAATYWPWLKDYNINTAQYVWCPPSVFVAEKFLEVDRLYGPWSAVAGDLRGKVVAYDYETSPSFAQRESLYGGLNAINPIVNFAAKGLEIYGQKTLLRANSALNRLNTRRMVVYAKKLIKRAMDGIVFEAHNADSWTKATNLINTILEPIRQSGGLEDYRVIIDSTTNTADLIAQNIMSGIIKLLPTGTIEIIELSIQIFSPGSAIS